MSLSTKTANTPILKKNNKGLSKQALSEAIALLLSMQPPMNMDYETVNYERLLEDYKDKDPYGLGIPPEIKAEMTTNVVIIFEERADGSAKSVYLNLEEITQEQIDSFNEKRTAIPNNGYIKKINANIIRLGFH